VAAERRAIRLPRPDAQGLAAWRNIEAGEKAHADQAVGSVAMVVFAIDLSDDLNSFRHERARAA
jgi:hypothetical protein